MNTEKTEKKIKQLFSELRAENSQRAPSFGAVMRTVPSTAATGKISFSWLRFAPVTTALVLLIATIAWAASRLHMRSIERERQQWEALSTWEAPTDVLLSVSGVPWGDRSILPSDFPPNDDVSPDTTTEKL